MRVSMPAFVLAAFLAAAAARAADLIDLTWDRLVPGGAADGVLSGIVEHGEAPAAGADGAADYEAVDDFNGETVRLPGYLVRWTWAPTAAPSSCSSHISAPASTCRRRRRTRSCTSPPRSPTCWRRCSNRSP